MTSQEDLKQEVLEMVKKTLPSNADVEANLGYDGEITVWRYWTVVSTVNDKGREMTIDDARDLDPYVELGELVGEQIYPT